MERLNNIGEKHQIEFIVSISASTDELGDVVKKYEMLN